MVNGYAGYMIWRVPRITIEKQPWKGVLIQPNVERSEALGKKGDPLGGGLKAWRNSVVNGQWLMVMPGYPNANNCICHSEHREESCGEKEKDSSLTLWMTKDCVPNANGANNRK